MISVAPRFVRDLRALGELLTGAKQMACPHCHRTGMLVGHGLLWGYAERSSEREIRGRRLLCSARFRRAGCGRTFSVLIATTIAGFTVRTATISALLEAVAQGSSRKAAWERLQGVQRSDQAPGLSLRSGYRLWARLCAAQSLIRTALCALAPPPPTQSARPIVQVFDHLRRALSGSGCLLASFQLAFQRGVFG